MPRAGVVTVRWIHRMESNRRGTDSETMQHRLVQLTGVFEWEGVVESNGDGFRCLKHEDTRTLSVMDSSHGKLVRALV